MQKNHLFTILGVIAVIVIGGIVLASKNGGQSSTPYAGISGADLPSVVGQPSLGGPKIPFNETVNYKEYMPDMPEMFAIGTNSNKATLLYFYADWCGTCRGQEPENAAFFDHALERNLPIVGLRINVDYNQPLMRQYRINYQHSYVLLDKASTPVDRFYGDHSEEDILKKVQQVL